jgi:cytochrome c
MRKLAVHAALLVAVFAAARAQRPATQADIAARDLTVLPDGTGLPPGSGDALRGRNLFKAKCADCHGERGEGKQGQYPALAGGVGSLAGKNPQMTVGSYWPYATTLFDYIRRAMPYDQPRTLSPDEIYSVAAFILFLDGIVEETQRLDQKSLPAVKMPNRDGFVPDSRPDVVAPTTARPN